MLKDVHAPRIPAMVLCGVVLVVLILMSSSGLSLAIVAQVLRGDGRAQAEAATPTIFTLLVVVLAAAGHMMVGRGNGRLARVGGLHHVGRLGSRVVSTIVVLLLWHVVELVLLAAGCHCRWHATSVVALR